MEKNEQGIRLDRYMVIPRVLVFIFDRSRVLLLKGAPDKPLWANKYNGVGGHIEQGEDVLQSARRELMEETGLEASNLFLVGTLMVDASAPIGVGIYILKGNYSGGQVNPSSEGALEWVELAHLPELPVVEDLVPILLAVYENKPGDPPFSARSYYDAAGRLQLLVNRS